MRKKSFSPIVTSIMLLIIVVSSILFFQVWFQSFQSTTLTKIQTHSSSSNANSGIKDLQGSELYFYNAQRENISIIKIALSNNSCRFTGNISADTLSILDISDCLSGLSGKVEARVTTEKDIFSSYFFIESPTSFCSNNTPENFFGGTGTLVDPWQICDCYQLQNIDNYLGGNFTLTQNIDCSQTQSWNSGAGFEPIGFGGPPYFTGTFAADSYVISDLYINRPSSNYIGLFSIIDAVNLSNLILENTQFFGFEFIGSFAGYASTSFFENSHSSGSLNGSRWVGGLVGNSWQSSFNDTFFSGTINGSRDSGGLVARSQYSSINRSYSAGIVTGSIMNIGGLVGYLKYSSVDNSYSSSNLPSTSGRDVGGLVGYVYYSSIDNSYSTGTVTGSSYIGGLVGSTWGSQLRNVSASGAVSGSSDNVGGLVASHGYSSIDNSYSTGTVTGTSNIGGLAGYLTTSSTINNSYSSSSVSGTSNVGGLVGNSNSSNIINNSYSIGAVTGSSNVGGLVGISASSTALDSYWDTDTSGQALSALGIGKTTSELQTPTTNTGIYLNWSSSLWDFGTATEYPLLILQ
ncbi:hypothetical protein H6501_04440 [Candidatus Woesearchaeota archaeon]|nr:hypothetical protein [Candidatus Woesearchaeota archaeon]